jgi:hypothetical protein
VLLRGRTWDRTKGLCLVGAALVPLSYATVAMTTGLEPAPSTLTGWCTNRLCYVTMAPCPGLRLTAVLAEAEHPADTQPDGEFIVPRRPRGIGGAVEGQAVSFA